MNGKRRNLGRVSLVVRWVTRAVDLSLLPISPPFLPQGDEKDGDAAEDSDEDDGFFVPHGYLSNDEGDCSDSGEFMTDPNEDVRIYRHTNAHYPSC